MLGTLGRALALALLLLVAGVAHAQAPPEQQAALRAELQKARLEAAGISHNPAEEMAAYQRVFEIHKTLVGPDSPELIQTLRMMAATFDLDDPDIYRKKAPFFEEILRLQVRAGMAAEADETRVRLIEFYDLTGQAQRSAPFIRGRLEYFKATGRDVMPVALDLSRHLRDAGDIPGAIAAISYLPADCLQTWAERCFAAAQTMFNLAMSVDDVATVDRMGLGLVARLKAGGCGRDLVSELSVYFEYKKNDQAGHDLIVSQLASPTCSFEDRGQVADWLETGYSDYKATEAIRREAVAKARSADDRAEANGALGLNLLRQERAADAIPYLKAAVDLYMAAKRQDGFALIYEASNLAEAYDAAGDHAKSLALLDATLAIPAVVEEMRKEPLENYLIADKARSLIAANRSPEARTLMAAHVRALGQLLWTYNLFDGFDAAVDLLRDAGGEDEARAAMMAFGKRFGADPNVPRLKRFAIRLYAAEAAGRTPDGRLDAIHDVRGVLADLSAFQLTAAQVGGAQAASVRQALGSAVAQSDNGRGAALSLLVDLGWPERAGAEGRAVTAEGFAAAQDLEVSAAARALAQTAARVAAGSGPLGAAARRQQDLAQALRTANEALTNLAPGAGADDVKAREAEVDRLGRDLAAVDAQLRRDFPQYAELVSPAALPLAEVQRRLRPGEGLLLITPIWGDLHVFAISKTEVAWHRLPDGADSAATRVAALRCQVDPTTCGKAAAAARRGDPTGLKPATPGETIPAFDLDAAYGLYRDLVAPVEGALKGVDQLFVTANGPLSGLPLGLLVTKPPAPGTDNGSSAALAAAPWLADRYALTTLPSVSSLRAFNILRAPGKDRPAFRGYGDPVLVGASLTVAAEAVRHRGDGGTQALANPEMLRMGLEPLPHTRDELTAMAQALGAPPSSLRLGADATETAVKTEADIGAARVVAFATHGLIPTIYNKLDEPGLVMTPPDRATAQDDGYLSASEAAGLKLSADWLILSACNTAAASGKPEAESLSGLARAFLYAGAKALLASHWSVLDDATQALMIEALSAQGRDPTLTKAQALQRAMTAVRTGHRADGSALPGWDPIWAHPAAWAPASSR